jgi:hypothetical protein
VGLTQAATVTSGPIDTDGAVSQHDPPNVNAPVLEYPVVAPHTHAVALFVKVLLFPDESYNAVEELPSNL